MRSFDRASVRARIAALLAVLIALWAFAAWVTGRESLNLLFLNYLEDSGRATEQVVGALQQERRLSLLVLGGDDRSAELQAARERTDGFAGDWRQLVARGSQRLAASDRLETRYDEFASSLAELNDVRERVDSESLGRPATLTSYSRLIDAGFAIYGAMSSLDNQEIAQQSSTLVRLSQARELLLQQDALLAGGIAAGELTEWEINTFTQLVGAQRMLYDRTAAELPAADRRLFEEAVASPAMTEFRQLEESVMSAARPGSSPPVDAAQWGEVATAANQVMQEMGFAVLDNTLQRTRPVVLGIIGRLLIAGGLGFAAVVLSIALGRNLIQRLEKLRDTAQDLANNRLPRVVRELRTGQPVDPAQATPPVPDPGGGEFGQLATAFNTVQAAAVAAAVGQAELRRGVRDVFLSLARRSQGLVHRQLKALDEAERKESDPDRLAELFRIDHLATRMRRNAENLIVLSGANSGRSWREPVPIVNLVRGAISEIEDYTRVSLLPVDDGAVGGKIAGDIIHLLAELMENAASYSPPYAPVTVAGQRVARGFAIEIEDRGLGMSEAELLAVNQKLAHPPDFDLADASHLGHYVVAKLAQRHEIKVSVRPSAYGGISAVVLLPKPLIVDDVPSLPRAEPGAAAAPGPELPPRRAGTVSARVAIGAVPSAEPSGDPEAATDATAEVDASPAEIAGARGAGDEGEPAVSAPPTAGRTAAGLPWRVRQASLPKQLREAAPTDAAANGDEQSARDPEAVRRMVSSYRRGTRLGRSEAAAEADPVPEPADRSDVSQDDREG